MLCLRSVTVVIDCDCVCYACSKVGEKRAFCLKYCAYLLIFCTSQPPNRYNSTTNYPLQLGKTWDSRGLVR